MTLQGMMQHWQSSPHQQGSFVAGTLRLRMLDGAEEEDDEAETELDEVEIAVVVVLAAEMVG